MYWQIIICLGGPELTLAAHPRSGQIVLMEMSHRFHIDHLPEVLDVALEGCKDIYTILDKVSLFLCKENELYYYFLWNIHNFKKFQERGERCKQIKIWVISSLIKKNMIF